MSLLPCIAGLLFMYGPAFIHKQEMMGTNNNITHPCKSFLCIIAQIASHTGQCKILNIMYGYFCNALLFMQCNAQY